MPYFLSIVIFCIKVRQRVAFSKLKFALYLYSYLQIEDILSSFLLNVNKLLKISSAEGRRTMLYLYKREPLNNNKISRLTNACDNFRKKFVVWRLLDTGLGLSGFAGSKKRSPPEPSKQIDKS